MVYCIVTVIYPYTIRPLKSHITRTVSILPTSDRILIIYFDEYITTNADF